MKVCMVSYSDIHSGNATRVLNLAKNLSDTYVKIIFDGSKNNHIPDQFKDLSITFTPYLKKLYPTLLYGILYKIKKLMKEESIDIVHCFKPLPNSFIPSFFISRSKGARLIVDWDDWEGRGGFAEFDPPLLRDFLDFFQTWSVKRADVVLTVSPFLTEMANKMDKKVHLIPNGANTEMFKPSKKKEMDSNLIVFVGLLYKSCDLDIVIRAMEVVVNETEAKLLVAGDGPRREEFVKLTRKLGLEKNVVFLGQKKREEVPEIVNRADVLALPMKNNLANHSRSPVKLGEYLACGKALVTNNVGIVGNVIKNHYNGVIAPEDPEDFGKAIVELLQNKGLRKKIETNARKTAEEVLDWKKISKKLENIYESMI